MNTTKEAETGKMEPEPTWKHLNEAEVSMWVLVKIKLFKGAVVSAEVQVQDQGCRIDQLSWNLTFEMEVLKEIIGRSRE